MAAVVGIVSGCALSIDEFASCILSFLLWYAEDKLLVQKADLLLYVCIIDLWKSFLIAHYARSDFK